MRSLFPSQFPSLPISRRWYHSPTIVHKINTNRFALLDRSEEHTSELQSRSDLVCRLLLEKKKKINTKLQVLVSQKEVREPRQTGARPRLSPIFLRQSVYERLHGRMLTESPLVYDCFQGMC